MHNLAVVGLQQVQAVRAVSGKSQSDYAIAELHIISPGQTSVIRVGVPHPVDFTPRQPETVQRPFSFHEQGQGLGRDILDERDSGEGGAIIRIRVVERWPFHIRGLVWGPKKAYAPGCRSLATPRSRKVPWTHQ